MAVVGRFVQRRMASSSGPLVLQPVAAVDLCDVVHMSAAQRACRYEYQYMRIAHA
jgi:hypothetical protein